MLWIIIGAIFLIFLLLSFDIVDVDKSTFVYIGLMSVFIIVILTTSSYFNKHQKIKESTEVYEVCRYLNNEYFQANTAGDSITIRVKTNSGVKEKTFDREIVTFVDSNSSTATVNYKKKEKFTSGQKFWFALEDGKDAGKKKATNVILSVPLDSEQEVEDSTEQPDTATKNQKEPETAESVADTVSCVSCGAENSSDAEYCSKCGAKLTKERTCTECGNKLNDGDIFCSKCGKKME